MINYIFKENIVTTLLISYVLLLSFFMPLSSILSPQLIGEDEALTYLVNKNILSNIINLNIKGILIELIKDWHPPGRNLLPLLNLYLFDQSITSLRFSYYIFWMITCILGVLITKRYSSLVYAYTCGALLAGSGLFHIQVMALSHGMITFFGMLIIFLISNENKILSKDFCVKRFIYLSIILYVGFLFFNTFILITMMFHFIQLYLILKNNNVKQNLIKFFITSFFIMLFYIIYLMIFIGIPMLMSNSSNFLILLKETFKIQNFGNWKGEPFGQHHQYLYRSNSAKLNYSSLLNNIMYLNWHFFPYLAMLILPLSILNLYKNFKYIFIILLPYFFITNFYMVGNTGQHFASLFIWLIPFFCISISTIKLDFFYKKLINFILILLIFSFTIFAHIYPYDESNFPYNTIKSLSAAAKWPPNLYRPLDKISKTIKEKVKEHDVIGFNIDGAIALYHLNDFKTENMNKIQLDDLTNENECNKFINKLKVFITTNTSIKPCIKITKEILTFNNSKIVVYIFN